MYTENMLDQIMTPIKFLAFPVDFKSITRPSTLNYVFKIYSYTCINDIMIVAATYAS